LNLSSRFRFKGSAVGVAGRIRDPFDEIIEVQAATALPGIGGHGSARSSHFRHRDIVRFEHAHSEVIGTTVRGGEHANTTFTTLVQTTVEGFNVLGMLSADRIVARLVTNFEEGQEGEPSVKLIGTRFENLKIAGIPVRVILATDIFDRLDTHTRLSEAYREEKEVREHFGDILLKGRLQDAPPRVAQWFHHAPEDRPELPASRSGNTRVSLVRKLVPEDGALVCWGHVIHLEGFGTIRLAEMEIGKLSRSVTMVQIDLGCPVSADVMAGSVDDGCSPE
jgi:hypothetical protein